MDSPTSLPDFSESGIAGLDEVLGNGFPRGQLYLVRGPSGAGKTTLSLQFLLEGAKQGERGLYLGTSETESDIFRIARSHGWNLDGVVVHHHRTPHAADEQSILHPAELDLPETMRSILSIVDKVKPDRLVVDSLAEIRVLARDELWYRRQLMTLKDHFAESQCTVLLIEIPDAAHSTLNSVVSGVVELEQNALVYGPDRRRLRVVKIRGQEFATGFHDYAIDKGGIRVFPRLTAAVHRQRFPSELLSTGVSEIDALLHGGLERGTSILLLGPSGTAKSLTATQLMVAAAERGEHSSIYVFDERVQTLFRRSAGVGMPLEKYVEEGLIEVWQVDPAELTPGEFTDIVKKSVEDRGLRMLVIDSLNGYSYAMPSERLLSLHLHELASYLGQKAVTQVFTMTQHGLLSGQVDQPFDVSYIADTVILFRHFEYAGQIRKAISVYKCRSGPHESTIRELQIGASGLEVGEPLRRFQGVLSGRPVYLGENADGDSSIPDPHDG